MSKAIDNLRSVLEDFANDGTIKVGAKAIEQKARNTMKRRLTEAMMAVLEEVVDGSKDLTLYRVEKSLMIGVDNEKVGIIPVDFSVAIRNMDVDPLDLEDEYKAKLEEQAAKAERMAKQKAAKMAADAKARELKAQMKALKEAAQNEADANDDDLA